VFLIARAVSLVGDEVRPFALTFAAYAVNPSPAGVGVVLAAGVAPQFVLLVVGGRWGDTRSPLGILIGADVARAVVMLATAVVWLGGAGDIPLLVGAQIVCGAAEAFFAPSAGRLVVTLYPTERLVGTNALVGVAGYAGEMVGPAVAAALLAVGGPAAAIAFDGLTFAASALLLACVSSPILRQPQLAATGRKALRAVASRPPARTVLVIDGLWALLGTAPILVVGPVICATQLDGPPSWAAVVTAYGVGGIVGGVLLARRPPLARFATAAFILEAPAPLLLAAAAPTALIALAALVGGAGSACTSTILTTLFQRHTPPALQATATGLRATFALASLTIGYLFIGRAASATGTSIILLASAIATPYLAALTHRASSSGN
jgi:Major Facilitator Superfamily